MRHINNILPASNYPLYCVDECGYQNLQVADRQFFMDVNSLDLFECDEKSLPPASTTVPQYPMLPNRHVRAVVLEMTHACQLRCDYCYVSHYYGEMASNMSLATAMQAVDALLDPKVVTRYGATVSFFGGEALLNFDAIKGTVEYIREKYGTQVGFGVTSNCCNLTAEKAAFLAEHNFSIVASIDGPASIHDLHRKTADGKGTHADVIAGLTLLRDAGIHKVSLRATFLPDCTRLLERTKYLNELCDEGLGRNVSVEPAFLSETACIKPGPDQQFTVASVKTLLSEYVEVADYLTDRLQQGKLAHFKNIMVFAERLLYHRHQISECGAGVGMAAVSPDGTIYACHREMNSKIGELDRGGIDERQRAPWMDNRCLVNKQCQKCDYRNICGGPCREHSIGATGDIHKSDPVACEFKRNWIKCAAKILSDLPSTELLRMVPTKNSHKAASTKSRRVNFVREAGGFGDIISMGGAARQLALEDSQAFITACVPNEFVEVAEHLEGFDGVMGLGSLEYLVEYRRKRGESLDKLRYTYLGTLPQGDVVDLWCPAVSYEMTAKQRLTFTRSQIFALQAKCHGVEQAWPVWKSTPSERREASQFLCELPQEGPVVAFCPRGTKKGKCLSSEFIDQCLSFFLSHGCSVVYVDCIQPQNLPEGVKWCNTDFCTSVAIAEQCDIVVSIDTSFIHAGPAVGVPTLGIFSVTDAHPYELLYPNTQIVQLDGPMKECEMPCNWAESKGFTDRCLDKCSRMDKMSVDLIVKPFIELLAISSTEEFQRVRLDKMLKK